MEGPGGLYLSKFAVDTDARGEGVAQEIWDKMIEDTPSLFWRARKTNPVNRWYTRVADGFIRRDPWIVFWKGVEVESIPSLVKWATSLPEDFLRNNFV